MPTQSSDLQTTARTGDAEPDQRDTMRFRAPTLEEAIAVAESSLGARVRVLAANRIRRGGVGGFFASDLGVEVTVALDEETIEDALERLVSETAATERDQWQQQQQQLQAQPGPTTGPHAVSVTNDVDEISPVLAELIAALLAENSGADVESSQVEDEYVSEQPPAAVAPLMRAATSPAAGAEPRSASSSTSTSRLSAPKKGGLSTPKAAVVTTPVPSASPKQPPVAIATPDLQIRRRPVYDTPPTMVRVEQIIEELSALTAAPLFSPQRPREVSREERSDRFEPTQRVAPVAEETVEPARETRVVDVPAASVLEVEAPAADARAADARAAEEEVAKASVAEAEETDAPARLKFMPTLPPRPADIARAAAAAAAASQAKFLATPTTPHDSAVPARGAGAEGYDAEVHIDVDADSPRQSSPTAPSQRHVELAVAATDQLIESLKRDEGVKRLSVRVVLRASDQREVEAEAEWESS
jgi:hypothetical protein